MINDAATFQIREEWTKRYGDHLISQSKDREVYYTARGLSWATAERRLAGSNTHMVIIIDAMDKAKFAVPRHLPQSKLLQDCLRPRLHVVGVIVHGFFKGGFIFDPTIRKDADLWVEVLLRSIQRAKRICKRKGMDVPHHLVVVSDNAGDNKNNHTFTCLALQVGNMQFYTVKNHYLRTGHSHEDIDAMFGHWARCLLRQPTLQTPVAFKQALSRSFPDTEFVVLSHVREYAEWFAEAMVHIEGMAHSVGAAHSFTFTRRQTYELGKYGAPTSQFNDPSHANDVILIPRKYMASNELCQTPLVVMPYHRLQMFRDSGIVSPPIASRLVYSDTQRKELKKTAKLITQYPFNLRDAANYLESLANGTPEFWSPPPPSVDHTLSMPTDGVDDDIDASMIHFAASIEPTSTARPLKARPRTTKFKRKHKLGRGRMSACPPPPQSGEGPPTRVAIGDIAVNADGDFIS